MGVSGVLTPEQLDFFNSNGQSKLEMFLFSLSNSCFPRFYPEFFCWVLGYLVLESFSSPDEIERMRKRMEQLLDEFDCSTSVVFSTKDHVSSHSPL